MGCEDNGSVSGCLGSAESANVWDGSEGVGGTSNAPRMGACVRVAIVALCVCMRVSARICVHLRARVCAYVCVSAGGHRGGGYER